MKIVVSLPEKDNEFQLLQAVDARATARRLGCSVEILYADNGGVAQIQQLYKAIHSHPTPRALVIEPIAVGGLETVLRKAATHRIPVALLNGPVSCMPRIQSDFVHLPLFTVGSDQMEVGRLQGQQLDKLVPYGGCVLYLHGLQGASAEARARGLEAALRDKNVHLVVLDGRWTEEAACRSVQAWMRLRSAATLHVDAVAAQNDAMARGARRATAETPDGATVWSTIPHLGIDGVPDVGQRMVDRGELTTTIVMPSNTGPAIEYLVQWLQRGTMPPARVTLSVRPYPEMAQLKARVQRRLPPGQTIGTNGGGVAGSSAGRQPSVSDPRSSAVRTSLFDRSRAET
jgi:ABC-type sugar transport system substrate-binding protein